MYVHCHKCGWGQDDFWDWKIYNPVKFWWNYNRTWEGFKNMYIKIKTMRWWTLAEYRQSKHLCPKCGDRLCED